MSDDPIYLDYNATTPMAAEVLEAMLPALRDGWGNPSSNHRWGTLARKAIDHAREQVAALLGCDVDEVIFTSGGTESDNLALIGLAEGRRIHGRGVVISGIEHPAIDVAATFLEASGWKVDRVPVDRDGVIDIDKLMECVTKRTAVISVMHAHNETGVIQPLAEIQDRLEHKIPLHTDAAQSLGKIDCNVDQLGVDSLTIAGHKLYGPKGVGALYVRRDVNCARWLHGAEHENGRRAGTENTPAIVGLGAACALALSERELRQRSLAERRDQFEARLRNAFPDLVVHGSAVERLPNTSFFAIPGTTASGLMERAPELAIGAGSACHSGSGHVSSALVAMGVERPLGLATLRVSVGRGTNEEQIERAATMLIEAAQAERAES